MTATVKIHGCEIQFADTDVVNPSEYAGMVDHDGRLSHCYNMRPWLLHDHGFTLAVVFATCERDAIDEAVDAGKLDRFLVTPENLADYGDTEEERDEWLSYLGDACEPFDIESLGVVKLENPPFSMVALFRAAANESVEAENQVDEQTRRRLSRDVSYYEMMVESAIANLRRGNPDGAMGALLRAQELVREVAA